MTQLSKNEIRQLLGYDMGSDLHEDWKKTFKLNNPNVPTRFKAVKDKEFAMEQKLRLEVGETSKNGKIRKVDTGEKGIAIEIDILNMTFDELSPDWQGTNLKAGVVAVDLVFNDIVNDQKVTPEKMEKYAAGVHDEWEKREAWQKETSPHLFNGYEALSEEEKQKDRDQLIQAIEKVKAYKDGKIDIDKLDKKYGKSIQRDKERDTKSLF